jgi:glycosidase
MRSGVGAAVVLATGIAASVCHGYPSSSVKNDVDFTSDVIYQIVTDRFVDGDPTNNPKGRFSADCDRTLMYCGGDWRGIESKILDGYLPNMGISAIQISVPVENSDLLYPVHGTSYHGYWPRDLKRTNPAFGTMEEFKHLVRVAHEHHIKVIIDFVTNQSSPAEEEDPGYGENGRLFDDGKLLGGLSGDSAGIFYHNGESDFSSLEDEVFKTLYNLADINQQNPRVDAYLKSSIKLWVDMGIDGIRVDTAKHIPVGWQRTWAESIYEHRPVFTTGEWYVGREDIRNPQLYVFANQSGMSILDFPLAQRTRQVFHYRERDMTALENAVVMTSTAYAYPLDQVTFIDNHDQNRITLSDSKPDHRRTEQATAFILTSRGIPSIFYGTEQYVVGEGHAPINRPMMRSFDTATPLYGLIKRLAALRKDSAAVQFGTQVTRWLSPHSYIFERRFHAAGILVAINDSEDQSVEVSGMKIGSTCMKSQTNSYPDVLGGKFGGSSLAVACDGTVQPLTLGAASISVWEMKEDMPGNSSSTPQLGHVGPMMGIAGNEVSLSGRHFGSQKGVVMFGNVPVKPTDIVQWEDTLIRVRVPSAPAGRYDVSVRRGPGTSEIYPGFELMTGPQISLRIVVDNATVKPGENVYIMGDVIELGQNKESGAIGPMFDKILYRYPTWYFDVNVPANTAISYKFVKKSADGSLAVAEAGPPHTLCTHADGTETERVQLNGWNEVTAANQTPVGSLND